MDSVNFIRQEKRRLMFFEHFDKTKLRQLARQDAEPAYASARYRVMATLSTSISDSAWFRGLVTGPIAGLCSRLVVCEFHPP